MRRTSGVYIGLFTSMMESKSNSLEYLRETSNIIDVEYYWYNNGSIFQCLNASQKQGVLPKMMNNKFLEMVRVYNGLKYFVSFFLLNIFVSQDVIN